MTDWNMEVLQSDVSSTAKLVFHLQEYTNTDVAKILNVNRRSVTKAMTELVKGGLLVRVKKGVYHGNHSSQPEQNDGNHSSLPEKEPEFPHGNHSSQPSDNDGNLVPYRAIILILIKL